MRRTGAVFLLLLWAQVATANALPCGLECALFRDAAEAPHHVHDAMGQDHAVGHHMATNKVSSPEHCGTPQLLVAMFVPATFPASPDVPVSVAVPQDEQPGTFVSAVQEFSTPPPRA